MTLRRNQAAARRLSFSPSALVDAGSIDLTRGAGQAIGILREAGPPVE